MNFFSIVIFGYFVLATFWIYILNRDRKNPKVFFGKHQNWAIGIIVILILGVIMAWDAHFIEPWTIKTTAIEIKNARPTLPIKIAFVSDIQAGNHKKTAWVNKIVERIKQEKPDLVIFGGDLIDNEGTFEDESKYLEPLKEMAAAYLTYAVLGNHEYGIGSGVAGFEEYYTGDRSAAVIEKLTNLGVTLLRNDVACPEIHEQKICLFGVDDLWGGEPNFDVALSSFDTETDAGKTFGQKNTLVFLTHNPDGIKLWPKNLRAPDLILSGHTHGGQVWLPFIGPLGNANISLPTKYYRGLNQFVIPGDSAPAPLFTSVGIGESGGAVRFWTLPEIAVITLKPVD